MRNKFYRQIKAAALLISRRIVSASLYREVYTHNNIWYTVLLGRDGEVLKIFGHAN